VRVSPRTARTAFLWASSVGLLHLQALKVGFHIVDGWKLSYQYYKAYSNKPLLYGGTYLECCPLMNS